MEILTAGWEVKVVWGLCEGCAAYLLSRASEGLGNSSKYREAELVEILLGAVLATGLQKESRTRKEQYRTEKRTFWG